MREFFDNLSEGYVHDKPEHIRDTTKEELDYIAARAAEAALARKAGSVGAMEDEADADAEEKELTQWAEFAGEASGAGAEAPHVEEAGDESSGEETDVDDPRPAETKHVLQQASSSEPVRPGRTTQWQPAQEQFVR